jgi:hypothetical protein
MSEPRYPCLDARASAIVTQAFRIWHLTTLQALAVSSIDIDDAVVHDVHTMLMAPATSIPTQPIIPEYFGKPLYDIRSGRFDPVGLNYALFRREMNVDQLAAEAGIARSTAYKALGGSGMRRDIVQAILGVLARHPPSLPPID